MADCLRLISKIPPSVNHYLAYRAVIKNGKAIGMSYKTKEALQYQKDFINYVKAEAQRQNWETSSNPKQHFYVDAIFYFGRTNQDANNYFKVMLDAITDTGLIWIDDNVVCERVQRVYYDSENPRIVLYIHPTDYIGVFANTSRLAEFEANCIGCKRYERNCSLLKRAKTGYIQREINGMICSEFITKTQE